MSAILSSSSEYETKQKAIDSLVNITHQLNIAYSSDEMGYSSVDRLDTSMLYYPTDIPKNSLNFIYKVEIK